MRMPGVVFWCAAIVVHGTAHTLLDTYAASVWYKIDPHGQSYGYVETVSRFAAIVFRCVTSFGLCCNHSSVGSNANPLSHCNNTQRFKEGGFL
jgi:hypothetical protein